MKPLRIHLLPFPKKTHARNKFIHTCNVKCSVSKRKAAREAYHAHTLARITTTCLFGHRGWMASYWSTKENRQNPQTNTCVGCLAHGKMLANGSPDEIKNDKRVIDAYLGAQ